MLNKDTYNKTTKITDVEDKVTWKDYDIKGSVKQYTRAEYQVINGTRKVFFRKQLVNFDENGKILDACDLNVKGEKTARGYYYYDKEGNLIELKSYNDSDKLVDDIKYTYNDKDVKIKEDNFNVNLAVDATWIYDEKGNAVENIEYSKNVMITDEKMKYNKETNALIEDDTIRYWPDGKFNLREITKYNKYGVVLSRFKYKDKDKRKLEIKELHYYDSKGCEAKLYIQAIGTRPVTCIYNNVYDEKGQLIKSTSPFYKWIFKYDNSGNQIKKTSYTAQDYLELELYNEYDADNNMLKETRIEYDRSPGEGINKKLTSTFDKEGRLIEWERDDKDGHYKHKTLYNDKGIMTEQIIDSPGEGRPRIKITYRIDSLGNVLEKRNYAITSDNEEQLTNIFEYSYAFY